PPSNENVAKPIFTKVRELPDFFLILDSQIIILEINKAEMEDQEIADGLASGYSRRQIFEKELYSKYKYFIQEGCRNYKLSLDDSFSAYTDAVLSVIHNVIERNFGNRSSLKTYLYKVFSNKCIDFVRKKTTNKEKVNISAVEPELLGQLPDSARIVVEKLIDNQKVLALKQYLSEIGEKCKQILLLFQDGYSDKEIAEQLAYNSASVAKVTRLRCLEKIREKMRPTNL
ncbi:MAG TPA: sigma-70 family RNA polymerase sigma factor, partial [Flavitalea sp.]|nr:sigma-70 family RNA polymerase sigma factor [Flavitalea sp.]